MLDTGNGENLMGWVDSFLIEGLFLEQGFIYYGYTNSRKKYFKLLIYYACIILYSIAQ